MHLTNVSIQKTAPDYDPDSVRDSEPAPVPIALCHRVWKVIQLYSPALWFPQVRKWTIQQLRRYLTAKHGRESVRILFEEIDNIFLFSLQSVQKVIINDKQSFELYGYDILLDRNLKPYVYLWCWICCMMPGRGRIETCADRWLYFSPVILSLHQLQWLKGGKCGICLKNNSSNYAFNFNWRHECLLSSLCHPDGFLRWTPLLPTWPAVERIIKWSSGCWKTPWTLSIWSKGKDLLHEKVMQSGKTSFQTHIHVLPHFPCRLTGKEKRVGGFDLLWNGGPVNRDDLIPATCGTPSFPANTHLGNQTVQLQHLPVWFIPGSSSFSFYWWL